MKRDQDHIHHSTPASAAAPLHSRLGVGGGGGTALRAIQFSREPFSFDRVGCSSGLK